MKKPMTTKDLFNKINGILKEKGKLPDILDYGLATDNPVPIKTCQFELRHNLAYGEIRGIYLNLWIEYFDKNESYKKGIGSFKTLKDDDAAMHTMASLLADFIIEGSIYIRTFADDFTWKGVNVYPMLSMGTRWRWHHFCNNMEAALKLKNELLEMYQYVVIRDNETREETLYQNRFEREE
ncbi:MAG: hypothetical protein HDR28_06345 [Lachnospiraceae bacterium]|nr:hypothetical protein [Lachnospiraceae bacterium]